MITFKAVCKNSLAGMAYGEIYTVEIDTLTSTIEYNVIDKVGKLHTLSSAQFHKDFEITTTDIHDFNLFLEDLSDNGLIDEEESDYCSDEYIRGCDIVDAIQYMVQRLQNECFAEESEDGDLQFIVSCLYEEGKEGELSTNKIILTVKHDKWTNSRVLFPTTGIYGFDRLEDIMRSMYNQTM